MAAPRLTRGPKWLQTVINGLAAEIDANAPISGDNITVDQSATGKGRPVHYRGPIGGVSGSSTPPVLALTILDASAKDSSGTTHPGRVRIVNGTLAGLLPDEMTVPDIVYPNGTDNHCYLTCANGLNYVYGKVLVDGDTGLFTDADVYVVSSPEQPDGTYLYLMIGAVNFDGTNITSIGQYALGSQSVAAYWSADGTILTAVWLPISATV